MPRQPHYYGLNHLHFVTASTYRRAQLFDSDHFRRHFIATLAGLRAELEFRIIGYVLMPEHANPVKRGLATSPEEWPWSSFRFYFLNDSSILAMDGLP